MRVIFETEALEEYRDAALYSQRHFGLGSAFVKAVRDAATAISESPERFQAVRNGIRKYRLRRFPFHLLYDWEEASGTVRIFAIAHHARRPGYWRKRLRD